MLDKLKDISLAELSLAITKIPDKSSARDLKRWIMKQDLSHEEIVALTHVFHGLSQKLIEDTGLQVRMIIDSKGVPERVFDLFKRNNIFRTLVANVLAEKGYSKYDTHDLEKDKSVQLEVIK